MAILDAISNFFDQIAEPFRVLYSTISEYIASIWYSLTVFQKIIIALILYIPIVYLIYKTLRKIQKEKERQSLNYLLFVDIPEGESCEKGTTNGTEYVKWNGNSSYFSDFTNATTMTYSFWIKVSPKNFFEKENQYAGPKCIMAKGSIDGNNIKNPCPAFWILNDNFTTRLWCLVYTEGGPTNGEGILLEEFPLNELFQLSLVVDNKAMNIYINGELVRTTILSGILKMNNSDLIKAPLQIDGPPENKGFDGCINLLRVSPKIFTPEQIRKFYHNEKLFIENKISAYDLTGKMEKCICLPSTSSSST